MKVNLPILIQNIRFGAKNLVVDCARILNYLSLDSDAIKRLARRFSYIEKNKDCRPKRDGLILANQHHSLLEFGAFSSRADLAKYLGVSRARVTQVLRRLNRLGKKLSSRIFIRVRLPMTERITNISLEHNMEEVTGL